MKITPTGVGDALKSLQSNRFYPISDMATSAKNSGKGTGSAAAPSPLPDTSAQHRKVHSTQHTVHSTQPAVHTPATCLPTPSAAAGGDSSTCDNFFSFAEITAGHLGRDRSLSFKRKNPEVSPNSAANYGNKNKNPRIETNTGNPLVTALQENLTVLEQVSNDILDAASSDPVMVSIVTRLCTTISCQNNVLSTMLANSNAGNPAKKGPPTAPKPTVSSGTSEPALQTTQKVYDNSSRKTLKQAPLGTNNEPWNEVKNRKNQKKDGTASQEKEDDISEEISRIRNVGEKPLSDPFETAVREAERSVVIYNLNLGQSPLLNPATISSKVTAALIISATDNLRDDIPNKAAIAGEMVHDLLSQVKSMVLFGKGTRPCKDPRNSANNGKFYTVPVKLSFGNKQVAKSVNDILRQKYKVSTSIPYHKTLKKAITMAHDRISSTCQGLQVLISLDMVNRCLKPFVREPPARASRSGPANWRSAGPPIQLPREALDPKIKEISEDFSLPATPVLSAPTEHIPGTSHSGLSTNRLKTLPGLEKNSQDSQESQESAEGKEKATSDEVFSPPNEEGMETNDDRHIDEDDPSGLRPEG